MKNEKSQSKIKKDFKNKKILILGFGKEGIDSYLALRKLFPNKVLAIADRKKVEEFDKKMQKIFTKDKKLKLHLGENYLEKIGDYNLIIKTPGIPEKVYKKFLTRGTVITSQTKIFFDDFPGIIIGVTGTKGKGTTSTLIYNILKKAGLKVDFGGNIGQPVLQKLQRGPLCKTLFVYELSSHQLQDLRKSPHIAVFLNLFRDHLDYYKNQNDYEKAKANIVKWQNKNDYLIYNADDPKVKAISQKGKARKIPFSLAKEQRLFNIIKPSDIKLAGDFNLLNIMAAIEVVTLFKISPAVIKQAIREFKGLPHRLEFAGKYKGIEFYNNSMATIPEATIVDLQTFNGKPISLIIGGSEKGSDYTDLSKKILKTSVKNLIILGEGTGQKIAEGTRCLRQPKAPSAFQANSMKEAVEICYEKTPRNGICLLSPASASFNMFKNYQDRGEQFKKWVKKLRYGQKND